MSVRLDPGREGRLRLAVYAAYDARGGDPAEFRQRCEQVVDCYFDLRAEQLAEAGYIPTTIAGCVAVLYVAARIINLTGGDDAVA
jgi:hypothetical protein